jgi:hypothetical protein
MGFWAVYYWLRGDSDSLPFVSFLVLLSKVGKWHLGHNANGGEPGMGFLPHSGNQGFERFFGLPYSHEEGYPGPPPSSIVWPPVPLYRNDVIVRTTTTHVPVPVPPSLFRKTPHKTLLSALLTFVPVPSRRCNSRSQWMTLHICTLQK